MHIFKLPMAIRVKCIQADASPFAEGETYNIIAFDSEGAVTLAEDAGRDENATGCEWLSTRFEQVFA